MTKKINHIFSKLVITTLLSAVVITTNAVAETRQQEMIKLDIGTFLTERSTDFRIDSKTLGRGTSISAEDDLGLKKKKNVIRADMYIRMADNHRLNLSYYDLSRDKRRVLDKTIQYGDEVFSINSEINSEFNLEIIKAGYAYSLINDAQKEFGISAGLFVQRYETSLELVANRSIRDSASVTAPLPVIGAQGIWRLDPKWQVRGSVDIFRIDYDDYKGRLTDLILAIEHNTFKNVGFGLGYNSTRFKLEADASNFNGEVNIDYGGLMLFTQLSF